MIRLRVALVAALAVLAVDTVTKLAAPHDGWTFHVKHETLLFPSALILAGVIVTVVFASVGMAVATAGAAGNVVWAALIGANPNPLVDTSLSVPGTMVAFNVADVALQGGAICASFEIAVAVAAMLDPVVRRAILRVRVIQ